VSTVSDAPLSTALTPGAGPAQSGQAQSAPAPSLPALLVEPTYGHRAADGGPYRPTAREVLREWLDAMDGFRHPERRLPAAFFLFHVATGIVGSLCLLNFTWDGLVFGVLGGLWISTFYHTLWYHRYCSHVAFAFTSPWFTRAFLWSNPVAFREEMYAIPHRIHHERSDLAGDPYGPHLGWLGSYLATESQQKVNTTMDARRYETLARGLKHIGFAANNYEGFQRTGSVERVPHYLARTAFAQALWIAISYALGGWHYVTVWYSAVFVFTFFMREFPWRGHGGNFRTTKIAGWEFDHRSRSLNSWVFGFLAGEWHDNHHLLPASANCAFLPGQVDVPFQIVRLWQRLGIVDSFYDASDTFKERGYATSREVAEAADASHDAPIVRTAEDEA
jgi:fatty-acid desaturase